MIQSTLQCNHQYLPRKQSVTDLHPDARHEVARKILEESSLGATYDVFKMRKYGRERYLGSKIDMK